MVSFMKLANFSSNEFIDQTVLDSAETLTRDSLLDITGNLHTPGLINASALSFSYSNLTITVDAPLPFYALFSDGTLASANGTTDGSTSDSATVDFSSLIPSTGSVTAYLVAVSGSVAQEAFSVVGPPVGHPDFSPSFQPYTAYAENQDTIQFQATTTEPDNLNTLFIASTVLSAGQTTITTSSTSGQVRTGAILSRNGEVLAADLASGAAATNVGTLGGSLVGTLPNPTLASTGATAGTYVNPISITVDSDGRISGISNVDDFDVPGNLTAGGTLTVNGTTSLQSTSVTSLSNSGNATITGTASAAAGTSGTQLINYTQLTNGSFSPTFGETVVAPATASNAAVQLAQLLTTLGRNGSVAYSASTTLTSANAGQIVFYTGSAPGTFTLPASNAAGSYLIPIVISNQGGAPLTVAPSTGNGLDATVTVLQQGQMMAVSNDGGTDWHTLWSTAGSTSPTVTGAAVASNQAVNLGQFTSPVGSSASNSSATALSTSVSFTAPCAGNILAFLTGSGQGSYTLSSASISGTNATSVTTGIVNGEGSQIIDLTETFSCASGAAVTLTATIDASGAQLINVDLFCIFVPAA